MKQFKGVTICLLLFALVFVLSGCGKKIDVSKVQEYDPDTLVTQEQDPSNSDFEFADVSEKDSKDIATAYVLSLPEYKEHNARDFRFVDSKKTICDSCFAVSFTYVADTDKEDFKEEKVTVVVKVQGGVVVGHTATAEGTVPRPPQELCVHELQCDDGRSFPTEQWNADGEICERVVYLKGNPCLTSNYKQLVVQTDELKNCIEQGYLLDQTAAGEYLCLFPDKSYCEVSLLFEGDCVMGDCFKECRVGNRGEGLYSSCTGNLIELRSCAE